MGQVPKSRMPGSGRNLTVWISLGLLMLAVASVLLSGSPLDGESSLQIIVLSGYCYFLLMTIYGEYVRGELMSPLALFFASCLLYFGISALVYNDASFFRVAVNRNYYDSAIGYVCAFSFIYYLAYRFIRGRLPDRTWQSNKGSWQSGNVIFVVILLSLVGWPVRAFIIEAGLYTHAAIERLNETRTEVEGVGIIRFLETFPDFAAWIVWIFWLKLKRTEKYNSHAWQKLAMLLLLIDIIYWIPTLSKLMIARSFIVPIGIRYLIDRRLPSVKIVSVALVIAVLMFPITYMIRVAQIHVLRNGGGLSIETAVQVIQDPSRFLSSNSGLGAQGRLFGRLNEYEVVSGAIRIIKEGSAELRLGADYFNFLVNLVPRVIWPDKPDVFYGNRFGHQINMIPASDTGTSIAPTLIGESFLNFGEMGVLVGFLIAALYFSLYSRVISSGGSAGSILAYAAIIPTILYSDASFALYFSALLRFVLFAYILSSLMRLRLTRHNRIVSRVISQRRFN